MDLKTLKALVRIAKEQHSIPAIFLCRDTFENIKREIIREGCEHLHTIDTLFILDHMQVEGVLVGWSPALEVRQIVVGNTQ